jgi:hypothetical protein|tara:strand:+ start:857 stop:1438 length:582 start_codon:yes stop_codon:yes gene_type:complete
MNKHIIKTIKNKIKQHHQLYRFPVKAELWEDIFDQAINGKDSNWSGGGHSVGADVISEGKDKTRYQNKSGDINFKKNTIKWNGHRTTSHKTIDDKLDFISQSHYDKYVMLGRNKKDWDNGIKRYWLLVFDSDVIDYKALDWKQTYGKNEQVNGWSGSSDELPYTAKIIKPCSDQLWTECDLDYLGSREEIFVE